MSKALIITEKPSVAADIARALGGFKKTKDYYESKTHLLSWAVGHLLELVVPVPLNRHDMDRLAALLLDLALVAGVEFHPRPHGKRVLDLLRYLARRQVGRARVGEPPFDLPEGGAVEDEIGRAHV